MEHYFDVKQIIEDYKKEGKHMVKFQVLGRSEKLSVTSQLESLSIDYDVYSLDDEYAELTPYDIIVGI